MEKCQKMVYHTKQVHHIGWHHQWVRWSHQLQNEAIILSQKQQI